MTVTIYTTPTCPYCKMTKKFLDEEGIDYTEKDVADNEENRKEMMDKSGQMGVPVIDIDGEVIVGFDKPKIKEALGQ